MLRGTARKKKDELPNRRYCLGSLHLKQFKRLAKLCAPHLHLAAVGAGAMHASAVVLGDLKFKNHDSGGERGELSAYLQAKTNRPSFGDVIVVIKNKK